MQNHKSKKPLTKDEFAHVLMSWGVGFDTWFDTRSEEDVITLVPVNHKKVEGDLSAETNIVFDNQGNFVRIVIQNSET